MSADFGNIATDHGVGSLFDGNRPLCIFTQGEAGNAKRGGFFLQATGIGQDDTCPGHQAEHFEITLRWQKDKARIGDEVLQAEALDVRPGSRVQGEYQRQLAGDFCQDAKQRGKIFRVVNI